jgi:hypothetical protein
MHANNRARKLVLVDYLGTFLVLSSSVLILVRYELVIDCIGVALTVRDQLALNWSVQD